MRFVATTLLTFIITTLCAGACPMSLSNAAPMQRNSEMAMAMEHGDGMAAQTADEPCAECLERASGELELVAAAPLIFDMPSHAVPCSIGMADVDMTALQIGKFYNDRPPTASDIVRTIVIRA